MGRCARFFSKVAATARATRSASRSSAASWGSAALPYGRPSRAWARKGSSRFSRDRACSWCISTRSRCGRHSKLARRLKEWQRGLRRTASPRNLTFHRGVLQSAGNETIAAMLVGIYARVSAMCGGLQASVAQLSQNCDEHERLSAALHARDADDAEREARAHVRHLAAAVERNGPSMPSQGERASSTRR